MEAQYIEKMEKLIELQRQDQGRYQRSLETVLAQVTQLTQLVEIRDQEIMQLRNNNPAPVQAVNNESRQRIPFAEIAMQIPHFSFDDDSSLTLEAWLRKIENVKTVYSLNDDVVRMMATNKFDLVL